MGRGAVSGTLGEGTLRCHKQESVLGYGGQGQGQGQDEGLG